MRLLFAGTPTAALPALERLINSEHEIVSVITRPDAHVGRGRTMTASPVAQLAHDHGLPLIKANSLKEHVEDVLALKPDVAVIVAFGALIREPLLTAFPWVNLHFSLLPAYRGAAPVQHALLNGEEITGVSAFVLNEGLDTGPVLGQMTERIREHDTAGELLQRLSVSGADLLMALLDQWGEITPVAQTNDGASLAPKLTVEMARINWANSGELIDRHIRAMNPSPGAWTTMGDQRFEIGLARLSSERLSPGVVEIQKDEVLVGTGSLALSLLQVKPSGKRMMSAVDWARGVRGEVAFL